LTQELSCVIGVSEVNLYWGSHGDVPSLDVIKEGFESARLTENRFHKEVIAAVGGLSIAAVSLDIDSVLRSGGCIAIR
jgi:hypothetical protein